MKMKKTLLLFGLVCIVAYSCSIDLNHNSLSQAEQITSQEAWQKVLDQADDQIKADYIDVYVNDNDRGNGLPFFKDSIDVNRPDLMEIYGIPVYTIDSALWATQATLPFENYLKLDVSKASFYILWRGRIINRIAARYQDETWEAGQYFSGMGDSERTLATQAIENEDRIISVNVAPKRGGGAFLVYVFKNGKWNRIDGGLRHDPDDVIQDLRNSTFNRSILQ